MAHRYPKAPTWAVGVAAALLSLGGCMGGASRAETQSVPRGGGPVAMNDAEIAAVSAAMDAAEIQQGQLAESRASDPRVRNFAEALRAHHARSTEHQSDLLDRRDITPVPNAMSQRLTTQALQTTSMLQSQPEGPGFDRSFLDAQVRQHAESLRILDEQLIPNARDPMLRSHLEQMRVLVNAHLQQAQQLQGSLLVR